MSMVDRLIEQLKKRGLRVEPGKEPGQLVLRGPDQEKTAEVLAALKKFKPQLLDRYGLKTETIPDTNGQQREPETNGEPDPEPERVAGSARGMCPTRRIGNG